MSRLTGKVTLFAKKLGSLCAGVLDLSRKFEVIVTVINLIAILVIVPAEGAETRKHQMVVTDYRAISAAITPLRINDEYTYDICHRRLLDEQHGSATPYFEERVETLRSNRMELAKTLVSAAMGMEETFSRRSYKEVKEFIKWNFSLDLPYVKICDQPLKDGDTLLKWERALLTEMRRSLKD